MSKRASATFAALSLVPLAWSCKTSNSTATLKDDQLQPASADAGGFQDQEAMDIERLKGAAFTRCQGAFVKPTVQPIEVLDPPAPGQERDAVGLAFQEELAIRTSNLLDRDKFYVQPRIRAALNTQGLDIYVDKDNTGTYQRMTWADAKPDFTATEAVLDNEGKPVLDANGQPKTRPAIVPPVTADMIPDYGKVLTELIIGHEAPQGGWPQLFDLRSNSYVRFSGFPPQVAGASFRLAAHRLWKINDGQFATTEFTEDQLATDEDFPIVRAMFTSVKSTDTANALLLVEGQQFCGALSLDMQAANEATITVDGYWFSRSDYSWQNDPNTGFAAYSSMFWRTEAGPPAQPGHAAHDSDTFRVRYDDGSEQVVKISIPQSRLRVHDLSDDTKKVVGWSLANEDRDPAHFAYFAQALHDSNYDKRVSYKVDVLESSIKTGARLYEHWTGDEYLDNICGVSSLREDIKKATSVADAVHFKYRTTSYFPPLGQ